MIKQKKFPPETILYTTQENSELNKLIPNFDTGIYLRSVKAK